MLFQRWHSLMGGDSKRQNLKRKKQIFKIHKTHMYTFGQVEQKSFPEKAETCLTFFWTNLLFKLRKICSYKKLKTYF